VYKSKDIAINVGWMQWFLAASVPGLLCLFLTPLVVYVLYPPELKQLDNKAIAKKGLDELGPMTIREKTLLGLFVLAVLSWALGERIGIEEASTTAISVMTLLVVCGVVAWEDLLKNKGAWNTLIWYGGLLGISSVLAKAKFFAWLSQFLGEKLAFLGTDGFSPERGLTTRFVEGAQVATTMRERAEQTWLVADSSKFGQAGFVSFLPLNAITGIITDSGLPDDAVEALKEHTHVRIV